MLDRATGATDASRTLVDSLSSVREDGGEPLDMCNTEDKKEAAPVRTPWTGSCGPEGTPYPTVMARLALFELLLGKMGPVVGGGGTVPEVGGGGHAGLPEPQSMLDDQTIGRNRTI